MAKGNQKGNREVRKPKQEKQKPPAAQASPFAVRAGMSSAPKSGGKKAR
jgi:hypothetical protein